MSRREDVLFCQIAMTNGLITKPAAEKALAFCDRKEVETGRRPLIGAVFTKHNLMDNESVKLVYGAVQKRLGTSAVPQLVGARPKGGAARRRARAERKSRTPTRPIDPKTLWTGVGALVAFLAIVAALIIMVTWPAGPESTETTEVAAEGSGSGSAGPSGGSGGSAGSGGGPAPATPKPTGSRELPPEIRLQVDTTIGDALSEKGTQAAVYYQKLDELRKQLADKGYAPYPRLDEAIAELKAALAEGGGVPPAGPSAVPPETPAASPTDPGASAETPSEPAGVEDWEKELLKDTQ